MGALRPFFDFRSITVAALILTRLLCCAPFWVSAPDPVAQQAGGAGRDTGRGRPAPWTRHGSTAYLWTAESAFQRALLGQARKRLLGSFVRGEEELDP
jgi:hypothetical protein